MVREQVRKEQVLIEESKQKNNVEQRSMEMRNLEQWNAEQRNVEHQHQQQQFSLLEKELRGQLALEFREREQAIIQHANGLKQMEAELEIRT